MEKPWDAVHRDQLEIQQKFRRSNVQTVKAYMGTRTLIGIRPEAIHIHLGKHLYMFSPYPENSGNVNSKVMVYLIW